MCTVPTQCGQDCQGYVDYILLKDTQSRGLKDLDSSGQSTLTLHLIARNLRQGAVCSMSQLCFCELPTVLVRNCPTASFCDTDFTELRGGTAREQGPNPSSSTHSLTSTYCPPLPAFIPFLPPSLYLHISSPFTLSPICFPSFFPSSVFLIFSGAA